jgi:hypothetical protein
VKSRRSILAALAAVPATSVASRGLGLAAAVSLGGCQNSYRWNQKLTVVVTTPLGERYGSAVSEITVRLGRVWLSSSEAGGEEKGEATVVEVAPGQYLFALGPWLTGSSLAQSAFSDQFHGERELGYRALETFRGSAEVPREQYPPLITFEDANDAASAAWVDPANLAASFGRGFSLAKMVLDLTDEPLTTGKIKQVLPWMYDRSQILPDMKHPTHRAMPFLNNDCFRFGVD